MAADTQSDFEVAQEALRDAPSEPGGPEGLSSPHRMLVPTSSPIRLLVRSDRKGSLQSLDVRASARFWEHGLRTFCQLLESDSEDSFVEVVDAAIGRLSRLRGVGRTQHRILNDRIEALAREARRDGWDGVNALVLQAAVVANAKRLVEVLPLLAVPPVVAVTEHGEVRFDWALSSTRTLTLTVGAHPQIAFSGLFDDTLVSGKEPWESDLPQLVQCCFERLRSGEAEAISGHPTFHRDASERRLRSRVLKAIEAGEELWQDAAGIARRSELPEELVLRVLYEDTSEVIHEQLAGGKVVFTTRRHYLGKASAVQKLLGAFRNRLR